MSKKKITAETTFVRSFSLKTKEGKEFSGVAQPYATGMYSCVEPGTIQGGYDHLSYSRWIKKIEKTAIKNGDEFEKQELPYGQFLNEEELEIVNS